MSEPSREVVAHGGVVTVRSASTGPRPPGSGSPLVLAPAKTAVVTVDMQRYFTDTPPFGAMRQIVPSVARLLRKARGAGITVVHVKTEFSADMSDAGRPGSRTRQMMDGLGADADGGNPLARGLPLTQLSPELDVEPGDLVVTKTRFSGFWESDLDGALRARGIESLVFVGGTTTVCVESTLRDSMFLGYNALVLSDCTADMSPELHESALARIELFFGWVCNSESFGSALEALPSQTTTTPATRA